MKRTHSMFLFVSAVSAVSAAAVAMSGCTTVQVQPAQNPPVEDSSIVRDDATQETVREQGQSTATVIEDSPSPGESRTVRPPSASPYRFEILGERGERLASYGHRGKRYVLGTQGSRYTIHLRNPTSTRVEAVVSVDGLDVIDGKRADYSKRGYILPPWGDLTIEGFRTSLSDVAAFRFAAVRDSYAARTGDARNVGVIGVAFFPERYVPPPAPIARRPSPPPVMEPEASRNAGPGTAAPSAAPPAKSDDAPADGRSASGRGRASESAAEERKDRKGLGTEFGERRDSAVQYTQFVRANESTPSQTMGLHYNDRQGLIALGIRLDPRPIAEEVRLRETADPFPGQHFASPPPSR